MPRISCDKTTNQYGKWLIDLCSDNQMYIVNGHTLGDLAGKFTCHTPRGSSVIDYLFQVDLYQIQYLICMFMM